MTAEEYFYNHWQKANRSRFGDYGDYDSDEYAIAFAKDYAELCLHIHNVSGQSEQFYCTCSRAKGLDHDEDGMPYCIECQKLIQ